MLNQCYHKKQKSNFKKEVHTQNMIKEDSIFMFDNQLPDTNKIVENEELKNMLKMQYTTFP